MSSPDPLDGRVRRGERNRERILDAVFALVRDGDPMPTAEKVAERAGVGTRTVFRHFDDMDSLHAEMHARLQAELRPLLDEPLAEGSAEVRARALVRRRARLYERIAPFSRSGALHRWRSPFLQRARAAMARRQRAELLAALPELEPAPAPLLEAFDLATSFEAWDRLRGVQRLGPERAQETLAATALALLRELDRSGR
jgi:AcrR family transcriptional regulator